MILKITVQSIFHVWENSDSVEPRNQQDELVFEKVKTDKFNYLGQEYRDFWSFYASKTCTENLIFLGDKNGTP